MLILLPPSETKRDGGEGGPLDFASLSWPEQTDARARVARAVIALAGKPAACAKALKLSARQMDEVGRNAALMTSPTMPALDRFTGTLYDALEASTLPKTARDFAAQHVAIQSACFGLVGAMDAIPAYRLSFDSKLPGIKTTLKVHWAKVGEVVLATRTDFILDARSEGYAALAPLPNSANAVFLRVVTRGNDGTLRALNHFNKKGKGEFVRALCLDGKRAAAISSADQLMDWAKKSGWELEQGDPGELNLVVSGVV